MIISFGGASAIGKTTLCQSFSHNHLIVPEVNILFENEKRTGSFWYYEKQIERFQLAKTVRGNAILDGDVFQPLWYNWIYGYPKEFASKEETHHFYLEKIKEKQIAFPDIYIIFYVEEKELRRRKENDTTRKRRNFEKHLRLVEPHKRYFRFLKTETQIPVIFIHFTDLHTTHAEISNIINTLRPFKVNHINEFEKIVAWLENNEP